MKNSQLPLVRPTRYDAVPKRADNPEVQAQEGQLWVCAACGKRARNIYGADHGPADHGWDESCMLNAVLCIEPGCEAMPHNQESA